MTIQSFLFLASGSRWTAMHAGDSRHSWDGKHDMTIQIDTAIKGRAFSQLVYTGF